jgi:hypothetical protein
MAGIGGPYFDPSIPSVIFDPVPHQVHSLPIRASCSALGRTSTSAASNLDDNHVLMDGDSLKDDQVTTRILSISGLRGVIGDGLDPTYVSQFAAALGTIFRGGKVVIARDGRSTGEMLHHAAVAGLMATGCEVLDAGICTTPTCGVLVRHLNAAGGLQITASHNPIEWNGLKPFAPDGSVFNRELGQQLIQTLEGYETNWRSWS